MQIPYLFVCKGEHIQGTFNETDNVLEIHTEKQEGDECLIDLAAAKTYSNGGAVNLLKKEKMPKESMIAAFIRY